MIRPLPSTASGLDFIELVQNYHKDAVAAGEWMKPDDDQRTILALQTKIAQVKARSAKYRGDRRNQRDKRSGKTGSDE